MPLALALIVVALLSTAVLIHQYRTGSLSSGDTDASAPESPQPQRDPTLARTTFRADTAA